MSLTLSRSPEEGAAIDVLATRLRADGGGRIGMTVFLADRRIWDSASRARRTWAPGLAVRRAWAWARPDRTDPRWFPQGVAHCWHTGYDATRPEVLLVSWYATDGQGARISVLDLATGRYHHVLLVEATTEGEIRPVPIHAGGLVWQDRWLHVAATGQGFSSFDLEDLMHDPTRSRGYEYLLPRRHRHSPDAKLRFSFLSLDRSEARPAFVVGEYARPGSPARLVRFGLGDDSDGAIAEAAEMTSLSVGEGLPQMQGAVVVQGTYYLTISHGRRTPGEVAVGRPGAWARLRFRTPPGPEDLVFHPPTGLFWSVTEHPGRRWVFAMPRRALRPRIRSDRRQRDAALTR